MRSSRHFVSAASREIRAYDVEQVTVHKIPDGDDSPSLLDRFIDLL
jgi:hypothetical protein